MSKHSTVTPGGTHRAARGALLALTLLALVSVTRAQTAAPPTPAVGTTGTLITLDIADLGPKPPKVWLTRDDTKKRTPLKLLEAGPTQLLLLLKKAPPAGLYDLSIKPKGGVEFELDEVFSVLAPQGLELVNAFTTPAHHVTIEGSFLGTKKGKLRIGGKPAKVLLWEAVTGASEPDAVEPPPGTIVAVVPKSLPNGTHPVEVTNHAGSGLTEVALTLSGSAKPLKLKPPLLSAQLGDALVSTKQLEHLAWGFEHRLTAVLDGADAGPTGELRLRYFINTNDLPKLLDQTDFDAFLEYERPLDGGGSELFRSQDCQITVTHKQDDGVVAGQVTALMISDLDEQPLLLQAGLFIAPAPGDLGPEGPGPSVLSFTSAPDEPLPGQPLTFSWETKNVDEQLTTCAIKLPGATSSSPCATSGSLEIVPLEAGSLTAVFYVYDAGLISDSALATALVGGPGIGIAAPSDMELHDESVFVRAYVSSPVYELTSVTASVGDLTIPLVTSSDGFTGTLPLDTLTPGLQTLTVTAVDALGVTSLDTRVFDYDKQPALELTLPTELQVATPTLPVYATASDPDGETVALRVSVQLGSSPAVTVASADDLIDTTVDLSPWDGKTVKLRVRAYDEGGWVVTQLVNVQVEGSSALTPLIEAPGQLITLDDSGSLAGFLDEDAEPPTYALLDLETLAVTPVPLPPGFDVLPGLETTWKPSLRFTPTGVVYEAKPAEGYSSDRHLFDWNLGELITLSERCYTFDVDGDYATFTESSDPDKLLYRRRFTAQTLVSQVGDVLNGWHAVDDNGDVAWTSVDDPSQVFFKPKGLPKIALGSDPTFTHQIPRLDAGRVVYARKKPFSATLGQIMLWDGVAELALTEFTPFHSPPGDYAIAGDWIAFNREGIGGQRQLWVRDLAGIETKLSVFADDSSIQALAPDGSVVFKVGSRRYLWRGSGEPEDIGSTLGWPVHRDGEWYILMGRQLFHVP